VAKKITPAHFRNPNFQNLSKPIYFRPLLIKTPPQSFKTIPKLYYFLTLFIRIFFFLRFRAVPLSRSISALWKLVAGGWQLSQSAPILHRPGAHPNIKHTIHSLHTIS
jgi:hypothetical protein